MTGYELISMRGRAGGTVRLYANGEARIALRSSIKPVQAFFIDREGRVNACVLEDDGRCSTNVAGVCGAAVFDGNARLICSGALGVCGRRLAKLMPELAIRAASELSAGREKPPDAAEKEENKSASPVTQGILEQAQRLFKSAEPADDSAAQAEPEERSIGAEGPKAASGGGEAANAARAIPNPFPRTYPDSYWQVRKDSEVLYGVAETAEGKLLIRAVPAKKGSRRLGYERYLIDVNGRAYRAHEQLQKRK